MRILIVVPRGKFNYKAPWTPLGAISVMTFLKNAGYEVSFIDRSFNKQKINKTILEIKPDVVCIAVASVRMADDALEISKQIKKMGLPVMWGGFFASENYKSILKTGFVDYVSMGEGEYSVLNLIRALENGFELSEIKGLSYLKEGKIICNEAQPLSNLKELPILNFTDCRPENYLHPYLFCKRMMYLYASKGCPSDCTFCSNPRFHCHTFRIRPIEYVIEEIKYLYNNCGLDGVYFSDECWYLKRSDMYEFCRQLNEQNISIYWGCELRFGIYNEEDLQFMYDHGCRWIFFGLESGDEEMLKKIKKNIQISQIKKTVEACNRIGIVAISSFIIGYPDETPQQLQNTIDLVLEIHSGVCVCNIFTPLPNTEIYEELVEKKQITVQDNIDENLKTMAGEYSPYSCNTIPLKDLRVIRSWFMWREFTKKSVTKESKTFEVAFNAIKETFSSIKRNGFKSILPGIILAAKEAVPIFWFAHFYPSVKKKYKLK